MYSGPHVQVLGLNEGIVMFSALSASQKYFMTNIKCHKSRNRHM